MMWLQFGSVTFDADLVAFDKDGTLIDFEIMWGRLAVAWVEVLASDDETLRAELFASLGYDRRRGRTQPQSPLAIATIGQLQAIAASVLFRAGVSWPDAEDRVRAAFQTGIGLPLRDIVRPIGDVAGLLGRLRSAGVRVAVVTTDHRVETTETLEILGITGLVDQMVCGDDGVPTKPAPHMLQVVCHRLDIEPARTAVVGDTVADLRMAERAGAGLRVAVCTGVGDPSGLEAHADVVLESIQGIAVGA
jgi:phosphoglycolate phosphatase